MNDGQAGDSGLRPADLEQIGAELARQADRLRGELATAGETEAALRADCDRDAADAGAKTAAVDRLRTRSAEARAELGLALGALDRMRRGAFGICTACGRAIGAERAMALPHTELCVDCRRQREATGRRRR
jgi:DnaK suppressor protein